MKPKLVYFIRSTGNGLIKIGSSRDPEKRLKEIQGMSPSKLEILTVIPGGKDKERKLHKEYAHLRSHGEWFFNDGELAGRIVRNQRQRRVAMDVEKAVMDRLSVHLSGGTYGDTSYNTALGINPALRWCGGDPRCLGMDCNPNLKLDFQRNPRNRNQGEGGAMVYV